MDAKHLPVISEKHGSSSVINIKNFKEEIGLIGVENACQFLCCLFEAKHCKLTRQSMNNLRR